MPAVVLIFLFCVYWGYFAFFEIIWKGQTPGKRYAGIRVIKETGRPIDSFEAIGRNLMRAVDGLPGIYGVGLLCMMLNKQNRRLGDFVAGAARRDAGRWAVARGTPSATRPGGRCRGSAVRDSGSAALDKAASDRLMSRSDFIRTTLADRLKSDGIEIAGAA